MTARANKWTRPLGSALCGASAVALVPAFVMSIAGGMGLGASKIDLRGLAIGVNLTTVGPLSLTAAALFGYKAAVKRDSVALRRSGASFALGAALYAGTLMLMDW